jgi:hypothetical protein
MDDRKAKMPSPDADWRVLWTSWLDLAFVLWSIVSVVCFLAQFRSYAVLLLKRVGLL